MAKRAAESLTCPHPLSLRNLGVLQLPTTADLRFPLAEAPRHTYIYARAGVCVRLAVTFLSHFGAQTDTHTRGIQKRRDCQTRACSRARSCLRENAQTTGRQTRADIKRQLEREIEGERTSLPRE